MSRPYWKPDPRWWPVIAESIPLPWPDEAIYLDLCWWEDQEKRGYATRPGRPTLQKRWGVSWRAVDKALAAKSEWTAPPTKGDGQRAGSERAAPQRLDADSGDEMGSERAASGQPVYNQISRDPDQELEVVSSFSVIDHQAKGRKKVPLDWFVKVDGRRNVPLWHLIRDMERTGVWSRDQSVADLSTAIADLHHIEPRSWTPSALADVLEVMPVTDPTTLQARAK